jgi:hypothetical protein
MARTSRLRMIAVTKGALECPPGEETIAFEIRWKESTPAVLVKLRDNMSTKAERVTGTRVIAFEYCATKATGHLIRWYLESRTKISGVVASARRNGGTVQQLGKASGPLQSWDDKGLLS